MKIKQILLILWTLFIGSFFESYAQDLQQNEHFMQCLSQFERVGGNDIIFSMPTPSDISTFLKKNKHHFDKSLLNSTNHVRYGYMAEQAALNIGVYAVNLTYAYIHKKDKEVQRYAEAIHALVKSMEIREYNQLKNYFIDPTQVSGIEDLARLSQMNIARIFCSLKKERRQHLTLLILTGAWIEALYLESKLHDTYKRKELVNHIGNKKKILSQIMLILDIYKSKSGVRELIANLRYLDKAYAHVKISVHHGKSKTVERDGELVIIENTKTVVQVSNEHLDAIKRIVEQIRMLIIR